jgi:predicted phage-related endonuclease
MLLTQNGDNNTFNGYYYTVRSQVMSISVETKSRLTFRRHFIGGSDARIIMGPDENALVRLWREKRGEVEPEDLSANLIVQLGLATEPLNRNWYQRNTGQAITDVQRRVRHPVNRWMAATLDGMVEKIGAVFEASSCCPGRSPKRRRPKSTWPSSSTICG